MASCKYLKAQVHELLNIFDMLFLFTLIPASSILFLYILFYTKYWYLLIPYCFWIYYDSSTSEKGGRPIEAIKSSYPITTFKNYFPVEIKLSEGSNLNEKKNYMFVSIPHGFLCSGFMSSMVSSLGFKALLPKFQFYAVTLTSGFRIPFYREYLLAVGHIGSSVEAISYVLKKSGGCIVGIVTGGAEEASHMKPGTYTCVMKNRKGFIKLALRHGTSLVPTISFGENDIFDQVRGPRLRRFQNWVKKATGLFPILPKGRGWFCPTYIPYKKPINVVVGKPIDVVQKVEPTIEQIDALHEKFMKELNDLFEENKHKYVENPQFTKLEFV